MTRLRYGLGLLAVLALAGGGWILLRDSSLVAVRDVRITGVTASEGEQVRAALTTTALEMTTLHIREEALRDAVANSTSVAGIEVERDFPHALRIRVRERQPVAALAGEGSQRIPVTGDGIVMRGVTAEKDLPSLVLKRTAIGPRITDRRTLRALAIASAAPAELRRLSNQLQISSRGVTVKLRNGPDLIFGTDADARQKWVAAARVLAESSAQGATYLDLRIPGRVAAGGLAPVTNLNPQPEGQNSTSLNG